MKYLAIFCPSQFQDPQGGPCSPKMGPEMGGQCGLKKICPKMGPIIRGQCKTKTSN